MELDGRRAWIVGALVALFEIPTVLIPGWSFFLTLDERWRFVFNSIALGAVAGWMGVLVVELLRRVRAPVRDASIAVAAFTCSAAIGWSLTEGRRVRDAGWRPFVVVVGALVIAWGAVWVTRRIARGFQRRRLGVASGVIVGGLAIVADAHVLPRLYPAFHVALTILAFSAFVGAAQWIELSEQPRLRRVATISAIGVALASLFLMPWLASGANTRFVVAERAPWVGKVLALMAEDPEGDVDAIATGDPVRAREGIDLRGKDVLLITIDALRADRLQAYGGEGLTPRLDALAGESMVFTRAYTPTPHTSYALTSMLTGKYMRPVLELPGETRDHPALPELLRQYGYRTAAFYPPAIFFVDAHRFRELAQRDFGFEYRKVMFAPAHARVGQLESYLEDVGTEHPIFAWVHLFEPHEPYEPPERFARGSSRPDRYDGEVATADDAVGRLVALFRRRRPGSTVIVTADHGEELGDHGGWYHGTTLYDEQVRVPLLWSSPGYAHGTSAAPVELIDLPTTLLAALGIPRDARMRGDDLGDVLAHGQGGPRIAFAEIADQRMAVEDPYKLICGESGCRLYDLHADPAERSNVADAHSELRDRLRAEIAGFVESIPRIEAMGVGDSAWPPALARAQLGDASAVGDVRTLLEDERAEVRAAAADALGRLEDRDSRAAIASLRADVDERVRRAAVLAGVAVGDRDAFEEAAVLAGAGDRSAALALLEAGDARGLTGSITLLDDPTADERERSRVVVALGELGDARAVDALQVAIADVRLRPEVIDALAAIGTSRASSIIAEAFEHERYLPARTAAARALFGLRHPQAYALSRRFVGMETPYPDALDQWIEAGVLRRAGRMATAARREGEWECDDAGCVPLADAVLSLPPLAGSARAVWLVEGEGTMQLDEARFDVSGRQQISIAHRGAATWRVAGDVRVIAVVLVDAQDEIPPPPPEPWE